MTNGRGRVGGYVDSTIPPVKARAGEPNPRTRQVVANPLIIYANIRSDTELVRRLLKTLGADENSLHGTLQAMLSAVRRMESGIKILIDAEEDELPELPLRTSEPK